MNGFIHKPAEETAGLSGDVPVFADTAGDPGARVNATRRIWDGRPPIVPDRIKPGPFRRLYRDWLGLRHGHAAPFLADMTDAVLAPCRAHLALTEIERPFAVRYLWVGEALVRLYGLDPTGTTVAENFTPRIRREVLAAYRHCIEAGQPLYKRRKLFGLINRYGYDRMMLPLTATGQRIDRVLIAIRPSDPALVDAGQWRADAPVVPPTVDRASTASPSM